MGLRIVGAEELRDALPMSDAIGAIEEVFRSDPLPTTPSRSHVDAEDADLLVMPSCGPQGVGVKLVTVAPGNPRLGLPLINGVYVLFSPDTFEPIALFDGAALTEVRTAAVSGAATRHLAREDAGRLVVFGAGAQAAAHVEAMRAVRPIGHVAIVSRTESRAAELARDVGAVVATPEVVEKADIVCTCTTSATPVFDGRTLPSKCHVNAIGAYTPETREIDDAAIARARVVVETKRAALAEAGDIVIPLGAGVIEERHIEELSDVVRGRIATRKDLTIFKSVGVAFEDLAIAAAAYERIVT